MHVVKQFRDGDIFPEVLHDIWMQFSEHLSNTTFKVYCLPKPWMTAWFIWAIYHLSQGTKLYYLHVNFQMNSTRNGDHTASTMTWYPTQSHYLDTEPTSPCLILLMQNAWLRNDKYQFLSRLFNSTRAWTYAFESCYISKHNQAYRIVVIIDKYNLLCDNTCLITALLSNLDKV